MNEYEVIVIGAGTAGLGISALLARRGYRVALIEKEPRVGGRASTFTYRGYCVDVGLHALASCSSSGIEALLKDVGAEMDLVPIRPSLMHFDLNTRRYHRATSQEALGEDVYKAFKELVQVVTNMPQEQIDSLHDISSTQWLMGRIGRRELLGFFKKITGFAGQPLDAISAGAFLETLKDAFMSEVTISYPSKGGIKGFSEALAHSFIKRGGTLITELCCQRVKIDNNTVRGISGKKIHPGLAADVEIEAPVVVCTNPVYQLPSLVDSSFINAQTMSKIKSITQDRYWYAGIIAGVEASLFQPFGENQFFQFAVDRLGEDRHLLVTVPSYADPALAPPGRHLVFADDHGPIPLGDDAEACNRLDWVMDMTEEALPGFRNHIDWIMRVRYNDILFTPRTGATGPQYRIGPSVIGVRGLYLAGDACYLSGSGIGSAIKSAWECLRKIERDNLLNKSQAGDRK